MMHTTSMPPWMAILININIVIGAAFYIGAAEVSQATGVYAPLTWLFFGSLLLPLVLVFFTLARRYPEAGGIYTYSEHALSPFTGFISGWCYFIGAIAGNATVIVAFTSSLTNRFPVTINVMIVGIFTCLSLFNIQVLERLQIGFALIKLVPFAALLLGVFYLASLDHLTLHHIPWDGIKQSLPLVLFAYTGLEACCAVIDKIEGSPTRAARVIISSFIMIMAIYVVAQILILLAFGQNTVDPFTGVLPLITSNQVIVTWGNLLIKTTILLSFLGSFYGMFYYNNWNLFAIARDKHLVGSHYLTKLNKNHAPWICVLVQAVIMVILLCMNDTKHTLVVMNDVGILIAYILSTVSFIILYKKNVIGWMALISCVLLSYYTTYALFEAPMLSYASFLALLLVGIILYKPHHQHTTP